MVSDGEATISRDRRSTTGRGENRDECDSRKRAHGRPKSLRKRTSPCHVEFDKTEIAIRRARCRRRGEHVRGSRARKRTRRPAGREDTRALRDYGARQRRRSQITHVTRWFAGAEIRRWRTSSPAASRGSPIESGAKRTRATFVAHFPTDASTVTRAAMSTHYENMRASAVWGGMCVRAARQRRVLHRSLSRLRGLREIFISGGKFRGK